MTKKSMTASDRRSGTERRRTIRFPVEVDIEWQASGARTVGSISDISPDGCFVLCSGDVVDGESVKLFIPFADGMKVQFAGVVANHVVEIGFGLRFERLSKAQTDLLGGLVRQTS